MDINQLIDELPGDDSVSTEAVEAVAVHIGPCCEKCGAPITAKESLVCQKCGWYASIGSYVEIDRSWEVATDPSLATEEDTKPKPEAGTERPEGRVEPVHTLPILFDLIALALQTDSTRVATLEIDGLAAGLGLRGSYHKYSHHGKREEPEGPVEEIQPVRRHRQRGERGER